MTMEDIRTLKEVLDILQADYADLEIKEHVARELWRECRVYGSFVPSE
jgi:hypothetical protein